MLSQSKMCIKRIQDNMYMTYVFSLFSLNIVEICVFFFFTSFSQIFCVIKELFNFCQLSKNFVIDELQAQYILSKKKKKILMLYLSTDNDVVREDNDCDDGHHVDRNDDVAR